MNILIQWIKADQKALQIQHTVGTIIITITPINDAPTTTDISTTINENRTARMVGITLQGTDIDSDNLTYSVVSDASNGSTSISGATLTYTANQDWNGSETITYKANDGSLDSNTSTVTITVTAVNDAPVSSNLSVSTNEDTANAITLSATDVEGSSLTYSIVSNPSEGSVTISETDVKVATYTPNQDWYGTDTFTFEATDDRIIFGNRNVATATITVNPINDAPTVSDSAESTNEDTEVIINFNGS